MEKQLLKEYKNGNYSVFLYTDGTKEKVTEDDFFKADFPDSIDLKITNYCDLNCPMCHENSSVKGAHADLEATFLKTLQSGTELAIGGGNPLSHPNLIDFLQRMKKQGVICNITVNERHLIANNRLIEGLIEEKLVWGVGVSVGENPSDEAVEFLHTYKNAVAHVICGIATVNTVKKLKDVKVLLLGYKRKGRGEDHFSPRIEKNILDLKRNIGLLFNYFSSTSLDNLAIEQTQIKSHITKREWQKRFMGKDGECSMYIDLVAKRYAISSVSEATYPIKDDINKMFHHVQSQIE